MLSIVHYFSMEQIICFDFFKYRRPLLYVIFLSAILGIVIEKWPFSGTYLLIYSNPWSFYMRICYM